jgi:hypothetical protein
VRSEQSEQQAFIEELQKDASLQCGADLVTDDLESCKQVVHAILHNLEKQAELASVPATNAKLVYLICDQRDRPATIPVRKFLKGQGYEVAIPVFEGDAATVRQANQDLTTRCDAVILFYGAGDEAWKRTVENDLIKMKAYRGGKPLLASHVYLAPHLTDDKQDLIDLEEPNLVRGLDGFQESEMLSFLKLLKT